MSFLRCVRDSLVLSTSRGGALCDGSEKDTQTRPSAGGIVRISCDLNNSYQADPCASITAANKNVDFAHLTGFGAVSASSDGYRLTKNRSVGSRKPLADSMNVCKS